MGAQPPIFFLPTDIFLLRDVAADFFSADRYLSFERRLCAADFCFAADRYLSFEKRLCGRRSRRFFFLPTDIFLLRDVCVGGAAAQLFFAKS